MDVLYKGAAGVVGGLADRRGCSAGCSSAPGEQTLRLAEHREGFVALAATFLAYGLTELVHGYGFLAVFVTACAIRRRHGHGYHGVLHDFVEQIERLLTALLLLLLGGFVAPAGWPR